MTKKQSVEEKIKEKVDGFNFEYEVGHFKVCAGAACVCRHVLKDYVKNSLKEIAQAAREEEKERLMGRLRAAIKYGDLREGNIENCLEQIENPTNYHLKKKI